MSNLLAAFGRAQLVDLPRRVARRRAHNKAYRDALKGVDGFEFMRANAAYCVVFLIEFDTFCQQVDAAFVDRYVVDLAAGLKTAIMVLNPARVMIGGGISKAGDKLFVLDPTIFHVDFRVFLLAVPAADQPIEILQAAHVGW